MLENERCLIVQEGDDRLLEVALQNYNICSETVRIGAVIPPSLFVRLQPFHLFTITSLIYRSPEVANNGLLQAAPQTNRLVSCVSPLIEILESFSVFSPHQLRTIVVSAPVGAGMETVVAEQIAVLKAYAARTTCQWSLVEPPDSTASPSSIAAIISDPSLRPVPVN